MPPLPIFLLLFSIFWAHLAQAANIEPYFGVPCITCGPYCLAQFTPMHHEQWQMEVSHSKCGPGRDLYDFCFFSHYQRLRVTIENPRPQKTTILYGDSSLFCCCCCFTRLSSEKPNTIRISTAETATTHYDQCQIIHAIGCTDASIDDYEISSCTIFGNGLILIKKGVERGFDWLCCFVQCGDQDSQPTNTIESEDIF